MVVLNLFIMLLVGIASHAILDMGVNIKNPLRTVLATVPIIITSIVLGL